MMNMDGTPMLVGDNKPFTRKDGYGSVLGRYSGQSGAEDIKAYGLGMKLLAHEGETIDLEDAEAELLTAACEQNGMKYVGKVRAQLLMALNDG